MPHDDTPLEELLRRRARKGAAGPDPDSIGTGAIGAGGDVCGHPELLAAYAEGQLPAASRERLESHLASCAACQTAVVRLVRLAPQESAVASATAGVRAAQPARAPFFRWRWAVPALAGVVLVGLFVYTDRERLVETGKSDAPVMTAARPAAPAESKTAPEAESARALSAAAVPRPPSREMQIARDVRGAPAPAATEKDQDRQQQRQQAPAPEVAPQQAAPAAAPVPPPAAPARPADAERLNRQESQVESAIKKEAPQKEAAQDALDQASTQKAPEVRPKVSAANKLAEPLGGLRAAVPDTGLKSGVARAGRATTRGEAGEEKAAAREDVAEALRYRSAPGAGTAGAMSMEMRKAAASAPLRKQVSAGTRRLALGASGQLLVAPAQSGDWQPVAIPSGAAVVDFAVFREHLWVLLPGGRVGHSPDLGRTWDPPTETRAEDATSISFTSLRSGEIQTRSGRRLRTTDGGETWQPAPPR